MKATILRTDGTEEEFKFKGKHPRLKEMQDVVGGYIELVYLPQGKCMVINEEGKLLGLPVNNLATKIYFETFGPVDVIVGEAIVCDAGIIK